MKLTIIREDGAVYKDGVSYSGLDLSAVPTDVHALQFNDVSNAGWVEFVQDDFGNKANNQTITSLPDWAVTAIAKWNEAKVTADASQLPAEDQPVTTIPNA
mgnify:CR=1 FL=1